MNPNVSLTHSKQPAAEAYPKPVQSTLNPHILFLQDTFQK